jgi:hypothetical protein
VPLRLKGWQEEMLQWFHSAGKGRSLDEWKLEAVQILLALNEREGRIRSLEDVDYHQRSLLEWILFAPDGQESR